MTTPDAIPSRMRQRLTTEVALLTGFLFVGLVLMPIAIYAVGQSVFGDYAGLGYWDFFANLSGKVRDGNLVAIFLIASPYIGWQIVRLAALAWRSVAVRDKQN